MSSFSFRPLAILAVCVTATFMPAPATAQTDSNSKLYLEVRLFAGTDIDTSQPNALGQCYVAGGKVCNGSYISDGHSSSISIGGEPILATQRETTFELLFSFTTESYRDSTVLVGNIYSMDLSDGVITRGNKKSIRHALKIDEPYDLIFRPGNGESPIRFQYRVRGEMAQQEVIFGPNTVTVKSLCQAEGVTHKFSSTSDLRRKGLGAKLNSVLGSSPEPIEFNTSFTTGSDGSNPVKYKVAIEFDPPLSGKEYPMRTTMFLRRHYSFDGPRTRGNQEFSYNKKVELVKGKMLKLVFPPDELGSSDFIITDTVIINP